MIKHTTSRGAGVARRSAFLVSAAVASFVAASAAQAQDAGNFAPELDAQAGQVSVAGFDPVLEAQGGLTSPVAPTPQIVISDPGTPSTDLDPAGVNGIGQMVVDEQNGFIGLCTASLINPRTVIFAAHCVNEIPAGAYGAANGGQPIGFGFSDNNNQHGNSAFGNWLNDGYLTNTGQFMYNSNYVAYNPRSTEPGSGGFLYADIAMAALDTPAAGIPTWALLFSPLPAQNQGANGTGYHVGITGYGTNGSASTGSTGGIDFRRRSANNMLGALASLDDFEGWLFGGGPEGLPQNLYWIDFDDPARGTAQASPFDFNAWRDNAVENEGTTASGDSGGPLILDNTYAMKVIIGTLSGGYTRFFNGQPANGYGTASFYQPTYLYWDWVAQNNPYHYVGAKAGDGNWADPNHWVTNLDPAYMVLDANGNLVNGVPTTPGGTDQNTSGKFGEACFQTTAFSDCYNVADGTETVTGDPIGTASNDPATLSAGALSNDAGQTSAASLGSQSVTANASAQALPAATLGNGLPGASGFVPDDYDGDAANGIAPRYFDVTLSATGTTTLDSTVTVDRFAISGAGAALDIAAGGSLTSLMDVNQYQGMMRVNGALHTPGDYMLMFGGLQGSGHIYTPFFTSIAGVIAPGGVGTVGTLTFHGDVVLSSGSSYLVDLGNSGTSDRIAVVATAYDADNAPLDGAAAIGGTVLFGATSGTMLRDGNSYTILTAEGGVDGTFTAPQSFSAILRPTLSYTPAAVTMKIKAGTYAGVVDHASPTQVAYAHLLDANRAKYGTFSDLYGPLDLQNQATIRATLEGFAPRAQTLGGALGLAAVDAIGQFNRERIEQHDPNAGGTVAMIGQPLQMAAREASPIEAGQSEALVKDGGLPDNLSLYLAGGYLNGDSAPMTGFSGRDSFDGWFGVLGGELDLDSTMLGLSVAYSDLSGDVHAAPQTAKGKLWQGNFYWKYDGPMGVAFDGLIGIGEQTTKTRRMVGFLGSTYTLASDNTGTVLSGEVGLGKAFAAGSSVRITPRVSLRANSINFGTAVESGGLLALASDVGTYRNLQARAGLSVDFTSGALKPYLTANYVHDFVNRPAVYEANFVGGVNAPAAFALAGSDHDWGELAAGLTYRTGNVDLGLAAHTTIDRRDVSMQSYRGSVTVHF